MRRIFPVLSAIVLLLAVGYLHGLWTDRWGTSPELPRAVARLDGVPRTVGEWRGEDLELDSNSIEIGGVAGYCYRRYENRSSGSALTVVLTCGRPGPMSNHTPEVCFRAMGYERWSSKSPYALPATPPSAPDQFWTARFLKKGNRAPSYLRIFWAWKSQGGWEAPEYPRLTFGGQPVLYRLYVLRPLTQADESLDREPCLEFLHQFLPAVDQALKD